MIDVGDSNRWRVEMPRGGKRPGAGRPKGSPNKITREARELIKLVVEENLPRMREWFARQWQRDDSGKVAANLMSRLIEFAAPKLERAAGTTPKDQRTTDEMTDAELMAIAFGGLADPGEAARAFAALRDGENPFQPDHSA